MMKSVAIVTGASQGIGRATAIRLAKDFDAVVLVARNRENLEETSRLVKEVGAESLIVVADVSVPGVPTMVVDKTIAEFGRIDALLNIAGAVPQIDLFEMTDAQWNESSELKLHGARRITLAAWPALKLSKGSVVFMSGNSAQVSKSGYAAVATINAAIVALAKAFADRGIQDNVQVNSVLPGPIMTARRQAFLEKWAHTNGISVEEATAKFPQNAGISRFGRPEEIADLLAFMVSTSARWMTGSALRMDGGEVKAV